jgi:excisionase family DNA binding protein
VAPDDPLTPQDVAKLFKVSAATVSEWAEAGRLPSFRTPGGHRRFRWEDVEVFLRTTRVEPEAAAS